MSNIILKAHSANQTVAEVVLKPGTTTKIKAQKQVNYELLQEASGRAPDHIVTKRVGKDLHINLDSQEGDELIIEGFYNSKDTALIGLAEDGQYYYYLPDTGEMVDYVTELATGDAAGQALGGQPQATPWWMGVTEGSILPWLAGIVAGFLATADDKEKPVADTVNVNANQDGSVTVDLPKTAAVGEKVTVEVTNPNGITQTVELTKEQDGSWTSSNPSVVPSVPAGSNSTTIANDQVKDGSTVTAKDKNGSTDSVVAANPTPDAPTVSPKDDTTGEVTVGLPTNNVEPGDQVVVSYTKPDGTQGTATLTKGNDGSWTSDNPAVTVGTDANGNPTATIPNTEVKDGSTVTAVSKDGVSGQTSQPATNAAGNPTPDAPKVSAPNDETGVVTVELPTNNVEPGDQVVVSYTKPDGTPATTTLTKQPDGSWTSDNPAVTVGTDANGKPVATFPNKEVKDNTPVTAVSKDGVSGQTTAPVTEKSGDPVPTAPNIIADETNGGAWVVDFPDDAEVGDKVAIKFTDPNGNDVEVIFTKTKDEPAPAGTWESNDPRLTFDPTTGSVKVPDELVKDGTSVSGTSYNRDDVNNEKGNDSKPATTADLPPGKPDVLPADNETGDVVIKLPTENVETGDTVKVEYTKPDGTKGEATLTKTEDGWQADPNNPDVTLDKDGDGKQDTDANGNPIATIPGDKVKDNTPVTATANDKTTEKGDIVVKLPTENVETGDTVKVEYTKPDGTKGEATLTKTEDGWQADPNNPDVTLDKDGDGKQDTDANGNPVATIPGDKVKDGTVATVTNPDGTTSTVNKPTPVTDSDTSGNPEPSAPTVVSDGKGGVIINLPKDAEPGDAVKVIYTNKDGETVVTTVVKDKDGTWKDTDPNTTINGDTLTIPNEAIKDGTEVIAVSVDASKANIPTDDKGNYVAPDVQKNPTEEELKAIKDQGKSSNATTEDVLPSKPTVQADDEVGVRIIDLPKDAENGDKVVVKYTTPEGKDKIAIVEKTPDGWKPVNDTPVVAELPTDVAEGTTATVTYTDPTGAEKEATLTFKDGEWKADPNNPDVEVGKDADGKPVAKLPIATIEAGSDVTVAVEGKDPVTVDTPDSDLKVEKDASGEEVAVLPNDKIKDGSPVTAYVVNAADKIPEDGNLPDDNKGGQDTAPNPTPKGTEVTSDDETGDVTIKLPTENVETGDTVKVEYTKPDGTKGEATLTKTDDGWKEDPNNPDVTLDKNKDGKPDTDANGNPIATIPGDKVKDKTTVTVTAGNADGTGEKDSKDTTSGDQEPDAPKVTTGEDKVTIELPKNGVEIGDYVKVGYIDKDGNGKIGAVTLTKDGWVSNDPNIVVGKDGTVATIDKSLLQPGSDVIATVINASAQNDEGKKASDTVQDATKEDLDKLKEEGKSAQDNIADPAPTQPTVVADDAKGVTVTMPTENVEPGDKVTVGFTKPGETTPTEVTYTAQPDGTWKAEPATDATDAGLPTTVGKGGDIVLPNDKVKDGSPVTAVASDATHPAPAAEEGKNKVNAPDPAPTQPTVAADDAKGVTVTMPTENVEPGDKVTVGFTKPGEDKPTEVVYTAQPDGTWKAEPATDATDAGLPETVAKGGEVTVPNDKVKDGSPVTAVATDATHPNETGNTANAPDLAPAQPKVVADDAKGVTVTMPTENVEPGDKVTVGFTKPGEDKPTEVVYTAQPDGTWKAEPADAAKDAGLPETVAEGGEVVIPNDKVKDGSPVTAVATDATHPNETGNTANAPDLAPEQPTVEANPTTGDVTVTMPTENVEPGDKVTVSFTKPGEDKPTDVVYTAQPDGTWKAEPADAAKDAGLPETVAEGGEVVIPNDKVKDNSPVQAVATDETNTKPTVDDKNSATTPQISPTGLTLDPKENGDVAVNLPTTNAEPGDKVAVKVVDPATGKEETVTLTKQPDGTWESDKPSVVPSTTADNPNTTTIPNDKVKDGSPVKAVAYDEGTQPNWNSPDVKTVSAADPQPEGTGTRFDDNGNLIVDLPKTNVEPGDKVAVTITDPNGNETPITFTKTPDGWTVDPADKGITINGDTATIPKSLIPNNSDVDADTINGADDKVAEKDTANNKVKTDKPTVDDIFAIDTSNPADEQAESLKVTGKTKDPNSLVEIVYKGEVIGSGKSDDQGNFEITVTPKDGVVLTKDEPIEVYATDTVNDKLKSDKADQNSDGQPVSPVVPEVIDGPEGHIGDRIAPNKPTLAQGEEAGSVVLTFPTADTAGQPIQNGDIVEVNFTDEQGNKHIVLFEKVDGGWQSDQPELVPGDGGNGLVTTPSVTIPADKLQDASTVAAQTRDIADNLSGWVYANAGSDEDRGFSPDPSIDSVVSYDTSTQADRNPEYVHIQGSAVYPAGSDLAGEVVSNGTVTISFPEFIKDGKPVEIAVKTDANGKFQLIVKESDSTPLKAEHNGITALSLNDEFDIVAFTQFQMFSHDTARGNLPSYVVNGDGSTEGNLVTGEVLPVLDGADYHIGDKALPEQPTLTPADSGDITNPDGGMKVGLPQSANAGDKVIVEFTDEENKPQTVTLTKQDDGSWKSSNSLLVPDVAPRTDEATIPEENLLDGSKVEAYSEDLAGNIDKNAAGEIIKVSASAGSDDYDPEKTATPTYSAVESLDTAGDTKPEKVTIVGKTEPKAEVVVSKDGVEVGKVTADEEGNFTLQIDNASGTLSTLDKLDMVATAPNKEPSDAAEVSVPRAVPATAPIVMPNPDDSQPGSAIILPQGNNTKVTINYFDSANNPKTTIVTKDPVSGLWNISGHNTKQDESGATVHNETMIDFNPVTGGVTIYEPALQDVNAQGVATTVSATGSNGNRSIYDRTTTAQVKAVSALNFEDVYAKDTSVAANDEPEELHFTIKTNEVGTLEQLNTKVEIVSPDGTVYDVKNIGTVSNQDGTIKVSITEAANQGLDIKVGSMVRVTQTTAEREPTIKLFAVPELGEGEKYHTDVTPPAAPKVTQKNGTGTIELPTENTHPGDKVVVSIVPTGQKEPTIVTLTKVPNGWLSDNPALVPGTVGQENPNLVVIPHRNIEDNSTLGAYAVGTEGKKSALDLVDVTGFTADIDPASISGRIINENTPNKAVEATINLNNLVDNNPDAHNAKELIVELPLIKDNGEKVTATFKFDVLDGSTGDLKQFLLKDSGIVKNSGSSNPSSNLVINSSEDDRLELTDGSTAKLDPNGIINAITTNDEGAKEVAYNLATLGYTPYVEPKTEAPTLLGQPHEASDQVKVGEVKVTPHADNDAMQITYPVEHGNGRTESVLAQKGADGKWTLTGNTVNAVNQNGEKLITIDENTGVVTLHPDALADLQSVTAFGMKTGKQPSDAASVIAGQEPQSIGEFWGTINDLLPNSPTAGRNDGEDVGVWRNGLQGSAASPIPGGTGNYGKSTALVSLVDQLKAANDFAGESNGVAANGRRASYTLDTNEQDNIVRIYNSLGNMNTNSLDHTGVVTVNTNKGNDAIVIGRDLGFSGETPSGERYMTVNTGEGHDVITVGATNDWFKVVQYLDYNPATGRHDIPGIVDVIDYDAPLPANARYLPNLDLYNDVANPRRTGGHLANANVNMGTGDDALVISGVDSVTAAAISWSTIDMGDGHNRLIIAPNGVDTSVEARGAIAQGSIIRGGKDTDYVQAPLVSKDARIELGAGNDTVKLTKVADTAQVIMGAGNDVAELRDVINNAVIDMGAGNDIVTMTGSFSNKAEVKLGDGDDRFNWGFRTSGGGVVDGGNGFDTISLQGYGASDSSPAGWRASEQVSNIKTADFKNVEEIVMNGNNVLDIKFTDMRDSSTHSFTLDDGSTKRAKFIVSANKEQNSVVDGNISSNKVDFGQTDWNRDSDLNLADTSTGSGARWADVGDVRIDGKVYDVYRHTSVGGSHDSDVLVQQGITII